MQDNSNGAVESTVYVVTFERIEYADMLVDVPGPPSDESRVEAVRCAHIRRGTGEAVAWAAVGEPYVVGAAPNGEPRETAGAVA